MKRPALSITLGFILGIGIQDSADFRLLMAAVVCALLMIFIGMKRGFAALPLCLIAIFAVSGYFWSDRFEHRPDGLTRYVGKTTSVEGRLLITDMKSGDTGCRIIGRLLDIRGFEEPSISQMGLQLISNDIPSCQIGDLISFKAKMNRTTGPMNPGGFDQRRYFAARKIYFNGRLEAWQTEIRHASWWRYQLDSWNKELESRLKRIYEGDEGDIMTMMLFGSADSLDPDIKKLYQLGGISHILAISGMHVTLFGMGIYKALGAWIKKPRLVILISCLVLWFYCLLSGACISSLRATLMFTLALSARFFGEGYDLHTALGLSALILLVFNPSQLYDIGFQLSYLAVMGIAVIYPALTRHFNQKKNPLMDMILVTVAASLATNPILIQNFNALPLYALPVNMLAVPASGLLLGFGMLSLGLSLIHIELGRFFGAIVYFILQFIELCCKGVAHLPWNMVLIGKISWLLILGYVLLLAAFLHAEQGRLKIRHLLYPGLAWVMALLLLPVWQGRELTVDFLAVGQGDSAFISYDGKCFFIDGGGEIYKKTKENTGIYTLLPFLKSRGISRLSGVFISHSDFDHVYGIIEVLEQVETDFIVLPAAYRRFEDELTRRLLTLALEKGIPVFYFEAGDEYRHKKLTLRCLADGLEAANPEVNNNRSMVLNLEFDQLDILFPGDLEAAGEERLTASNDLSSTEILKIAHHGSQTSSTQLLIDEAEPHLGILSYGIPNRFGHPQQEVVGRYKEAGVRLLDTPLDGAIQIKSDGSHYRIRTYYTKTEETYLCKP